MRRFFQLQRKWKLAIFCGMCWLFVLLCCRSGFKICFPPSLSLLTAHFIFIFHTFSCDLTWHRKKQSGKGERETGRQRARTNTKTFIKYALCNLSSCEALLNILCTCIVANTIAQTSAMVYCVVYDFVFLFFCAFSLFIIINISPAQKANSELNKFLYVKNIPRLTEDKWQAEKIWNNNKNIKYCFKSHVPFNTLSRAFAFHF